MRGARVRVQDRDANAANTCSRSATVMIGSHTAAPMICPRCSRSPAMRADDTMRRTALVDQRAPRTVGTPESLSHTVSARTDSPAITRPTSSRTTAASRSRMVILSGS